MWKGQDVCVFQRYPGGAATKGLPTGGGFSRAYAVPECPFAAGMAMTEESAELEAEIAELEAQQRRWIREVEDFYATPGSEPTQFDVAPHVRLRRRAVEFVEVGIAYPKDHPRSTMTDASPWEIHYQLVAIGTGILLNAAMMKEDYERFAELANHDLNWTPGIKKGSQWVTNHLHDELSAAQRERITQVLRLLRVHRHNSANLGVYRTSHHKHPREVYRVLAFLFDRFFDADDVVQRLLERVEEFDDRVSPVEADYRPVDFDI